MAKPRYLFDAFNRLVISERDEPTGALRPRRVLEGRVSTDKGNRLTYEVESSSDRQGRPGPSTFNLDGTWKLTKRHELALTLHEAEEHVRQTVYLKGALVEAKANALIFALRRYGTEGVRTAGRLTLSGRWQADAKNRLTFLAERADGSEDRLTLQGGWDVGPHHELLYRYRQLDRRDHHEEHTLTFAGAWNVTQADRLVYQLAGSTNSAFEFKASLQSPSLLARDERIVYQIGIGLSGGKTQQQRVTLFGTWKLNRDLSVSFDMPYADGRVQAIHFEGTYAITAKDRIAVALQNSRREHLGVTVTFTKDLVPDTSLFLRLRKDAEESSVIGGVQIRF